MHTPTVPLRLLSEAAFELAINPDERLVVDPSLESHISETQDGHMIRDVIFQNTNGPHPVSLPRFNTIIGELETCSSAEELFFMAIKNAAEPTSTQSLRVVTSDNGRPLILQKNANAAERSLYKVPSALTLENLTIGNITWPAGQIVQLRTPHRIENAERLTTITHDQVIGLGVIRSSAFALRPAERDAFKSRSDRNQVEQAYSDYSELQNNQKEDPFYAFLSRASMSDIRRLVKLIIERQT